MQIRGALAAARLIWQPALLQSNKGWKVPARIGQKAKYETILGCFGGAMLVTSVSLFAQGKIDLQPSDTMQSILQKNVGQMVELRMKSGEKIGGRVEKLGAKLVHLSELSGAEFYDAAVAIDDVSAVVVRVKK